MRACETILRTQIIAEADNYMYFTVARRGLHFKTETLETIPLQFRTLRDTKYSHRQYKL